MTEITSFTGQYAYLSNFYVCPVVYKSITWPTAEHAFQAMKNPDPSIWPTLARISTAKEAKKQGRRGLLRPDWDDVKRKIMLEIVLEKFYQNAHLRSQLMLTQGVQLIEGNTRGDTYWGAVPLIHDQRYETFLPVWGAMSWHGQNWLGCILMMVREVLL